MGTPDKIVLLQKLLANDADFEKLLVSLSRLSKQQDGAELPLYDDRTKEHMTLIVKQWLSEMIIYSKV